MKALRGAFGRAVMSVQWGKADSARLQKVFDRKRLEKRNENGYNYLRILMLYLFY